MNRASPILASLLLLTACADAPAAPEPTPSATELVADAASPAMYRGGPQRTGVFIGPGLEGQPAEAWRFAAGSPILSQPAVAAGVAYFGSDDGVLYAVDLRTGAERWRHDTGASLTSSPAIADDILVTVTTAGRLVAVDAQTGAELWHSDENFAAESMPAIVGQTVYTGTNGGTVLAMELLTGEQRWSYDAGAAVTRSVAVSDSTLYFGADDATFHAIDAETGSGRWTYQSVGGRIGTPAARRDWVYFVILDEPHSQLTALDPATGEERWRFAPENAASLRPVVLGPDSIYVADSGGTIYALDPASGAVRWSMEQDSEIGAAPALVDGHLYVGSRDRVFAVDVATGREVWSFAVDGNVEYGPVVADGLVLAGTQAGSLYAIGSADTVAGGGSAVAEPSQTPAGEPVAELIGEIDVPDDVRRTAGPVVDEHGTLYVADLTQGRVLSFDADGSLVGTFGEPGSGPGQLDFLRDDTDPYSAWGDLALAPDGTLWVANPDNFRVDHFTTDGTFIDSIGSFGSGDGQFLDPISVSVSPDGAIFVVDDERDVIQRFGPDGTFELAFGGHGSAPGELNFTGSMTLDAEGNVWIADWGNNRVQAFDPDGVLLANFGQGGSGPGQLMNPADLAIDAAGRIYVADFGNLRIQAFEPDGTPLGEVNLPGVEPAAIPASVGIANGELYVTPFGSRNILVYRLLLPQS